MVRETRKLKDYPDILSVEDVRTILGIGRAAVYELIRTRQVPGRKIAGKYKIPKDGLVALIKSLNNNEICLKSCYNRCSEDSDVPWP